VSVARSAVELPRGLQWTDVVGGLCGLDDADGNTIALGLVEEVADDTVRVLAPLPRKARVARVRVGHERKDGTPLPRGVRYAERLAKPGQALKESSQ
jgi:polynucleotide 5'-kinase involved in rRNA processing